MRFGIFGLLVMMLVASGVTYFATREHDVEKAPVKAPAKIADAHVEIAYDRVMRSGTLRCGYVITPPNLVKDPASGQLYGLDYELTQAVGRKLGLKIDWVEEVTWPNAISGLTFGRYDAVCSAAWVNPKQGREAYFSKPFYYQPLFAATRASDTRFDLGLESLNSELYVLATLTGDVPKMIAEEDFPKLRTYSLPELSSSSMVLDSVATNKADVTFIDAYQFGEYEQHNSGQLKLVQTDHPVRIYPAAYMLPMADGRLRAVLDNALDEIILSGQMDKLLLRYSRYPNSFLPIERPRVIETSRY